MDPEVDMRLGTPAAHRSALGGALLAGFLLGCAEKPPDYVCRDCNLLLIVSDTLRADALSAYGGPAHTPNLDRLAARGTLFERAYSSAPWTFPSLVSMFAGHHADTYFVGRAEGRQIYYVPDEQELLSEVLRDRGYDVVASVENGILGEANVLQSFDLLEPGWSNREVIKYLRDVQPDHSFYLLKWIVDPHSPYQPSKRWRERIDFDTQILPRDPQFYMRLTCYDGVWREGRDGERVEIDFDPNEDEVRYLKTLYHVEVESVDERVGQILSSLDPRQLEQNTIVVFTSDHGEEFREHGKFNHGQSYFEELLRVPLVIVAPGLPAGLRVSASVSLLDLMPTLRDLLGLPDLERPGQSLEPEMRGLRPHSDPRILYFSGGGGRAVVEGRFKLIEQSGKVTLYDREEDPTESVDRVADEPEVVDRLLTRLRSTRAENRARRDQLLSSLNANQVDALEERALEELRALGYVQ